MRGTMKSLAVAMALLGLGSPSLHAAPKSAPAANAVERAPPSPKGRHAPLHGVVNLNSADEATLEMLPGVGPAKSKRIVDHRKGHPFRKVEELTRVKGFGRKTLQRLRPYLAISGPNTLGEEDPRAVDKALSKALSKAVGAKEE